MFDVTLALLLFLGGWVALFYGAFFRETEYAERLRPRIISLLGIALILGGFFQPWLRFDASEYIGNWVFGIGKELSPFILERFGKEMMGHIVDKLLNEASLNAWQAASLLLFTLKARVIFMWLPVFWALITTLWIFLSLGFEFLSRQKWVNMIIAFLTIFLLGGVLSIFWEIDALGLQHNMAMKLMAVLLGAHVGNGPFITMLGLGLLAIGCSVTFLSAPSSRKPSVDEEWEQ